MRILLEYGAKLDSGVSVYYLLEQLYSTTPKYVPGTPTTDLISEFHLIRKKLREQQQAVDDQTLAKAMIMSLPRDDFTREAFRTLSNQWRKEERIREWLQYALPKKRTDDPDFPFREVLLTIVFVLTKSATLLSIVYSGLDNPVKEQGSKTEEDSEIR
ncbi:hypothetical protein FRC02_011766 [Tulasnella sp. 418]|nr:hypothetical protein FRC02_011766 [Tulasnella sp. 418]